MWNLFIFANHSWNYLGSYTDYDRAQEDMEEIKNNSERMVSVEQVRTVGSNSHMKGIYKSITGVDLN